MYDHVIFDFDGTIADSEAVVTEMIVGLAEKYKVGSLTQKEIKHRSQLPLVIKLKLYSFIKKIDDEFKQLYYENVQRIPPFDGMPEILKTLNRTGLRLSIITSNRVANVELFLNLYGIDFIERVITSKGLHGKHKALSEFRKKYAGDGQLLYVGDEIRDIEACQKANVDMAFVKWGLDGSEDIGKYKVKYIVNTPSELLEAVKS